MREHALAWNETSVFVMVDRQLLGDVVVALLIAIPAAALGTPQTLPHDRPGLAAGLEQTSAAALASAADRQIGLFR